MSRKWIIAAVCVWGLIAISSRDRAPTANAQLPLPEAYRRVATWVGQPQPRPAGEFSAAAGTDVADDGTVYVVDTIEAMVHVLAADGRGVSTIGGPGRDLGQMDQPHDVAVVGDRAYVTDAGNRRVQVFDASTGRFVAAWPDLGRPWGIAAGGDRVYVSDSESGRVAVLDRAGVVVETWGAGGDVALPLIAPRGLDVDAAGNVFVADPGAGVIFVIDPARQVRARLKRPVTNPDFLAIDVAVDGPSVYAVSPRQTFAFFSIDQETMWVPGAYVFGGAGIAIGPGEGFVVTVQDRRVDFSGVYQFPTRRPFATDATTWGAVPIALGALAAPRRVAADADGAFLLDARPRVQRWSASGTPLGQWRAESVVDVVAAPGGDVFVLEPQAVGRRRADGAAVWEWRPGTPDVWFTALAASASGVRVVDAAGRRLLTLPVDGPGPTGAMQSRALDGVVVDVAAGGSRWLAADRAGAVFRLFDAGGREMRWPFPGRVTRVAAAPDGTAWFALTADGWVWKYAPDGTLRAAWDGAPEGNPLDLDVEPSGRVLVVDGAGNRVFAYLPDPTAERPVPPAPGDRCDLSPDKTAEPAAVAAGDAVTVTLRVTGDCPTEGIDLDVVLVLDRSSSMAGAKFNAARNAAMSFTFEMDFQRARVALVSFGDEATLDQPLTAVPADVVRALAGLGATGTTALGPAIREARTELTGPRARPGVQQAVVLLTDGLPQLPGVAREEAAQARAAGIAVFAIGLGGDLDRAFLVELAGGDDRAFSAPTDAELADIFTRIARRLVTGTLVRTLDVTDIVPGNMSYQVNSADPAAAWDGVMLRWSLRDVPPAGVRLSYRVHPRQAGVWPTNVRAAADYVDGVGFRGRLVFPIPRVSVAGNRAVYLPFLFQNQCAQQRSDIALVIDTSTSMTESATPGGPSKLDAARAAARDFLGYLRLPADQAAIIAFNTDAAAVHGLTGDRAALERALDRLPLASGTRIDRGLAAAQAELHGAHRRPGNLPVVVLLTDGQPAGGTAPGTLAQAAAIRAAGTFVFTIGLGADADGGLLVAIADDAERYSYAPDQGALERIYRTIAWSLPCGGG